QRILRQGPRNLAAFLAYSQGLEGMDRGDYRAASAAFNAAVRADPTFSAARDQQQAAGAAPVVQSSPGDDPTTAEAPAQPSSPPAWARSGRAARWGRRGGGRRSRAPVCTSSPTASATGSPSIGSPSSRFR